MNVLDTRSSWRRGRRWRIAVTLLLVAAFFGTFHRFFFLENFDVVEPGRLYRSGQPKTGLAETIRAYGLGSIVNLRGGSPRDWWFRYEHETAQAHGVTMYDLPMSHNRRPLRRELVALLRVFDEGPYPILIHCKSGSDRTGLAVSLYRLVVRGEPPEQAVEGFSLIRGHVPFLGMERLHEPFHDYQAWLTRTGRTHTPDRFRDWLWNEYDGGKHRGPEAVATGAQSPRS